MANMSMSMTSKLVFAFVTLLLGAVLIGSLATNGLAVTVKNVVVNEVIDYTAKMQAGTGQVNVSRANSTVTYSPTGWKVVDCPISSVVATNGSGTALTLDTDYYLVASTGTVAILNTTATNSSNNYGNSTKVTYTYCGDDYMNLTWGRTAINLVAGFFAITILMISLGLFYSMARETGML